MSACSKRIVKFNGGLGNQMFQYAFACAVAQKFNCEMLFDYAFFEDVKHCDFVANRDYELGLFNITCPEASKEDLQKVKVPKGFLQKHFPKIFGCNFKREKNNWNFDKNLLKPYVYCYEGYFQNEKYFKHLREKLISDFTLNTSLDEKNLQMLEKIKQKNSVSLHVRRGDYVSLENINKIHGTCSMDYYKKAVNLITKKIENPHFFLFSDDINWVLENIKLESPYTVVDFNQSKGYLDMELMKNCKHNIIANSSFSWWAAWLNQNPEKLVISPKNWTAKKVKCDIIPKDWIKI